MQRLKTREQFQAVMAAGTVSRTAHFALHRCSPGSVSAPAVESAAQPGCAVLGLNRGLWVGALIPKRWAKRSVTRNAIKRQIYAVAGLRAVSLPESAHVVRLRAAFDPRNFVSASSDALKAAVRVELQQLFERATPSQAVSPAAGYAS